MKSRNIVHFFFISCLGGFCHAQMVICNGADAHKIYLSPLQQSETQSLERDHPYHRLPEKLRDMLLRLGVMVVSSDGKSLSLPRGNVNLIYALHRAPASCPICRTKGGWYNDFVPDDDVAVLLVPLSARGSITLFHDADRVRDQNTRVRSLPSGFFRRIWRTSARVDERDEEATTFFAYAVRIDDANEDNAFLFASIFLCAGTPTVFVIIECMLPSLSRIDEAGMQAMEQ